MMILSLMIRSVKCDLSNHWDKSVGDGHSHSQDALRTAGPVVGVATPLTHPLPGLLTSEKAATLTPNRLSSTDN